MNVRMNDSHGLWAWVVSILSAIFSFLTDNWIQLATVACSVVATIYAVRNQIISIKVKRLEIEAKNIEIKHKKIDLKKAQAEMAETENTEEKEE